MLCFTEGLFVLHTKDLKRRTFKFPVSQLHVEPEQPKLLPGRKPIIQKAERPIQSKTRSKVSTPESSTITESSEHHDKVTPVSACTIPQTMSKHNSIS